MFNDLYLSVYRMPYPLLAAVTAAFLVLIALFHVYLSRRVKIAAGSVAAVCILVIILYITLFGRNEPEVGLVLMPGYGISRAFISDEYLRMVLMNIFVFIPYGAFLSLALSGAGARVVVPVTICSGLAVTVLIEALQYILNLGCAETDDVICNVAGVIIGLIPYFATYRIVKKRTGL